jgi:MFS family permease
MNRHNRLLQFTALASTLDRFAMPPMLLAISRDLDIPVAGVASAAGAYFLAYGLMQPVWGLVSSRLGVVRSLRLAVLLAAFATAGTGLATDAASLAAFRLVAGGGFSAAVPAALFYAGATAAPGAATATSPP